MFEEDEGGPHVIGHWYVIALNLKHERFDVIDSYRSEKDERLIANAEAVKDKVSRMWGRYSAFHNTCRTIAHISNFPINFITGYKQRGV